MDALPQTQWNRSLSFILISEPPSNDAGDNVRLSTTSLSREGQHNFRPSTTSLSRDGPHNSPVASNLLRLRHSQRLSSRPHDSLRRCQTVPSWGLHRHREATLDIGQAGYITRLTTLRDSLVDPQQTYLTHTLDKLRTQPPTSKQEFNRLRMCGNEIRNDKLPFPRVPSPPQAMLTTVEKFRISRQSLKSDEQEIPLIQGKQLITARHSIEYDSEQKADYTERQYSVLNASDGRSNKSIDETVQANLLRLQQPLRSIPNLGRKMFGRLQQQQLDFKPHAKAVLKIARKNTTCYNSNNNYNSENNAKDKTHHDHGNSVDNSNSFSDTNIHDSRKHLNEPMADGRLLSRPRITQTGSTDERPRVHETTGNTMPVAETNTSHHDKAKYRCNYTKLESSDNYHKPQGVGGGDENSICKKNSTDHRNFSCKLEELDAMKTDSNLSGKQDGINGQRTVNLRRKVRLDNSQILTTGNVVTECRESLQLPTIGFFAYSSGSIDDVRDHLKHYRCPHPPPTQQHQQYHQQQPPPTQPHKQQQQHLTSQQTMLALSEKQVNFLDDAEKSGYGHREHDHDHRNGERLEGGNAKLRNRPYVKSRNNDISEVNCVTDGASDPNDDTLSNESTNNRDGSSSCKRYKLRLIIDMPSTARNASS